PIAGMAETVADSGVLRLTDACHRLAGSHYRADGLIRRVPAEHTHAAIEVGLKVNGAGLVDGNRGAEATMHAIERATTRSLVARSRNPAQRLILGRPQVGGRSGVQVTHHHHVAGAVGLDAPEDAGRVVGGLASGVR